MKAGVRLLAKSQCARCLGGKVVCATDESQSRRRFDRAADEIGAESRDGEESEVLHSTVCFSRDISHSMVVPDR